MLLVKSPNDKQETDSGSMVESSPFADFWRSRLTVGSDYPIKRADEQFMADDWLNGRRELWSKVTMYAD